MGMHSVQGKEFGRRLMRLLAKRMMVFVAVYGVVMSLFWGTVWQQLAYWYADVTSPWTYVSQEQYNHLAETIRDTGSASFDLWYHSFDDSTGTSSYGSSRYAQSWLDIGFWTDRVTYAVRDLSGYRAFLGAQHEAALALFFLGVISLLTSTLMHTAKDVDALSYALEDFFTARETPPVLPDTLAHAQASLTDIRQRVFSDTLAAKAAEQRKNELVAYLAHDVRTPITSVMGYLSILCDSPDMPSEQRKRFASTALAQAERLDGLVEEFFEITRYNLQAIPIEREQVDLKLFCEQLAEELYCQAQEKHLSIAVFCDEGMHIALDPNKMARAMGNILRNAVAYAQEGSVIKLQVSHTDVETCIEVIDEGKEISPEHLEAIFTKFFREAPSRTSAQGGAGLGLAISKEIVRAHGGTISATSEQGTTVFCVRLPR